MRDNLTQQRHQTALDFSNDQINQDIENLGDNTNSLVRINTQPNPPKQSKSTAELPTKGRIRKRMTSRQTRQELQKIYK